MESIDDFENLGVNMDLDDGTSLSPHWNTDVRRRLPEGPHSHITPFVRDRTTAQTLASVNRFGRNQLSCATDCPPNHICYPKGETCILGDEREGREHCCEYDNNQPSPAPSEFLKAIGAMTHLANFYPHLQSYSDPGFFRAFKRLFAQVLLRNKGISTAFWYVNAVNVPLPILQFYPDTVADTKQQLRLLQFGGKVFTTMMVHFQDIASTTIRDTEESIRNNPQFFWDYSLTQNNITVPPDFLRVTRNLSFTAQNTSLTEQNVFDMIVQKLNDPNHAVSNVVVQIQYQQAGGADFSAITRACLRSSFKGRILCNIHPQTLVTEGMFGSIGIYVRDDVATSRLIHPRTFFPVMNGAHLRTMIIESH